MSDDALSLLIFVGILMSWCYVMGIKQGEARGKH